MISGTRSRRLYHYLVRRCVTQKDRPAHGPGIKGDRFAEDKGKKVKTEVRNERKREERDELITFLFPLLRVVMGTATWDALAWLQKEAETLWLWPCETREDNLNVWLWSVPGVGFYAIFDVLVLPDPWNCLVRLKTLFMLLFLLIQNI